ncbi:MAG: histidinol-phosphate transaminase [Brevibacillus sp.]|nr:histidinol-phosphate transaminase [Brevibacillus sp.]
MKVENLVRKVYPNLTPYISQLPDLPVDELKQVLGTDKVYKLSFNENPLGPSRRAIEAMQKSLSQLNLYPCSSGKAVIQRIAEKEGVHPRSIILSNGADDMILLTAQTFLEPDDEVIIPKVTFVQYLAAAHLMGARPVISPMKEDLGIDLAGILERITPKTKLIFLCNPNNPTGTVIPSGELEAFLNAIPGHVLVVIDEAYHEYADGEEYVSSVEFVKQKKNVFVIRTFSKVYSLAAARIGYGIGQTEVVDAISRVRPPFNVNGVAQAGALASLDDSEHVAESKRVNNVGKQLLYDLFEELGMPYLRSFTNFVYVDTGKDSQVLFERLAKQGIIVRTLTGYGLPTSLRVSIGHQEEMEAFRLAFQQVLRA